MTKPLNITGHARGMFSGTTWNANASSVSLTVYGQLVSMKNSKTQRAVKGRAYSFKHPDVKRYELNFSRQVPMLLRNLMLPGPLRATVTVFYPSRRQDLDCALIFDCLQTAGVIQNDRQIIEQHLYADVDKKNPRCEIFIEEI